MWNPTEAPAGTEQAAQMLGDVRELTGQLGRPPGAVAVVPSDDWRSPASTVDALRDQVTRYVEDTVSGREWPVILRAWAHTREGKAREVIALDREWGITARNAALAEASFRVGRRQLAKLRGLRHERVIARYLEAIEAGQAQGWHPVVYGVVLAVYHLPLRQGLVQFAAQSVAGLVSAAERSGRLPTPACQEILDAAVARMPHQLPALPSGGGPALVPFGGVEPAGRPPGT